MDLYALLEDQNLGLQREERIMSRDEMQIANLLTIDCNYLQMINILIGKFTYMFE